MPRIIEVVVSPRGETIIKTKGYAGAQCIEASRFLELALGIAIVDRTTSEFHEQQPLQQNVQQQ